MDKLERALVFVTGSDWEGIYVEGLLVKEGHSISILDALMIGAENPTLERVKMEAHEVWLDDRGSLPTEIRNMRWHDEHWQSPDEDYDPEFELRAAYGAR
jgi:hypothetical protein